MILIFDFDNSFRVWEGKTVDLVHQLHPSECDVHHTPPFAHLLLKDLMLYTKSYGNHGSLGGGSHSHT
jgi:hypothetical protein